MTDFARLVLDADTRGLKQGQRDLGDLGKSAEETARGVDKNSATISSAFGRVGVAIAGAVATSGALGSIIQVNREFGASMSNVAAISGATASELEELRAVAIQMGADTAFSASQAADALGFLAQAGFTAREAIDAIPEVLALAAAGGIDLARAADIAANVLSGFNLEVSDASRVSDVLAQSAAVTNSSVEGMGEAMSVAAPIASALGISIEETAAAIGLMSDAGIKGSEAGTALRGIFASLAGPTTQAQDALAKYGLTAADIDPQTVGLANAMAVLSDRGISTADAFIIFGREAASGALVIAENSEKMSELVGEFGNAEGAARRMAEVMRDNLAGDIDGLSGSVDTLLIKLGDAGVTGALRSMAQFGTTAVNALSSSIGPLISLVTALASGFVAYRLTLLAASAATTAMSSTLAFNASVVMATARSVGVAQAAQVAMTGATTAATGAFRAFTAAMIANPFTAVAVAVGVLATSFVGLANAQAQARAETDNLIRSLDAAIKARGADVASKRAEADVERMRTQGRLDEINAEQRRLKGPRGLGSGNRAMEIEAQQLTWRLVQLEGSVRLADRTLADMEKTAGNVAVPVTQAATAVTGLKKELDGAGASSKAASNEFQSLYDRLFPFQAASKKFAEEMALIQKSRLSDAEKEAAIARLEREALKSRAGEFAELTRVDASQGIMGNNALLGFDATLGGSDFGLIGSFAKPFEEFDATLQETASNAQNQTLAIADSFGTMADRTLQALDRMVGAIRGGGFLNILSGVLNFGLQLAGIGVFGKAAQQQLQARADGGQVNAGRTYLVGERGPELFSPASHGSITPNSKMQGGGMVINVDARGSTDPEAVRQQVERGILEAAPSIVAAAEQRTIATLRRPRLAGAM
jgi:TP901 family phage tail tape measure protein